MRSAAAVAYDAAGNLYLADSLGHQVLEATLAGDLRVVAGTGVQGFAGDGGPATAAELNAPRGLAIGADGSVYIADTGNNRIRVVSPDGQMATAVGTGSPGRGGDGGAPLAAQVRGPTALAFDTAGALLFCDTGNNQLRRSLGGVLKTFAGTGAQGFGGDGGSATLAVLDGPEGVAVGSDGTIYLADTHNHRVRRIGTDGRINTLAGSARAGYAGDGGSALNALLSGPQGLALAADGSLLIADAGNERVRTISPGGVITTLAGSGMEGSSTEGTGSLSAALQSPRSVAVSPLGYIVLADTLRGTARAIAGQAALYQPAALQSGRTTSVTTAAPSQATYGRNSLAATVQGPVGVPLGQVQVTDGGEVLQQAAVHAGVASLDMSLLDAGAHRLLLQYLGDGLNPASDGSVLSMTILPAPLTAVADPVVMIYGAALPNFAGLLSGLLPQDVGKVQATFAPTAGDLPAVGSYPISATLTGSDAPNYALAMSEASGRLQVLRAPTVVSMSDPGPSYAGVPLAVQATVRPPGRGQPTGTVQFLDGNTVFATGQLNAGTVTGLYAAPPSGVRSLSVQYLGDGNFDPGSSGTTVVAPAPMPDFAVITNGASTATTAAGGTALYSLTVSAQPGPFTGAIGFSAAGLPGGASLTFSPPQIVPGSGSAQVTVTVQTLAAQTAHREKREGGTQGFLLAVTAFVGFGLRRRGTRVRALCALTAALVFTGCGARTVGQGLGGVLSQSYPLQITGTATNLAGAVVAHSTVLTLTVQGASP